MPGEMLHVTVTPNAPEWEGDLNTADFEDLDTMAEYARQKWREHVQEDVQLAVAIEKQAWVETGRFGTAEDEERMVSDAFTEAEKRLGLV